MHYFGLLAVIFFVTRAALSYPIFYKCSKNGEILDDFAIEEEKDFASKLTAKDCGSFKDCMGQFKQLLDLTYDSNLIAGGMYKVSEKEILEMNDNEFKSLSYSHKLFKNMRLCHSLQSAYDEVHESKESAYLGVGDDRLTLYYPHESTYQYITGHRKNNPTGYQGYGRPRVAHIKGIIQDSIATGVDPMAVMGMLMMERGGDNMSSPENNMHDSRHKMVLGCANKSKSVQIAKNVKGFEKVAKDLSYSKSSIERLYCIGSTSDSGKIDDHKGFYEFSSLVDAQSYNKNCCIKTHYDLSGEYGAKRVSTYLYFKQIMNLNHYNPMAGKYNQKDVLKRLNTFWGASRTTGTYPSASISPFRLGYNTFHDPNYARQIMDFNLNSFMRSGYIKKYIDFMKKRYGKGHKSLLCVGKKPGNYKIDSDHYFNKINETKRMKPIKIKYDKVKAWDKMGIKFQSVLMQEFTRLRAKATEDAKSYASGDSFKRMLESDPNLLTGKERERYEKLKKVYNNAYKEIGEKGKVHLKLEKYLNPKEKELFPKVALEFFKYRDSNLRRNFKKKLDPTKDEEGKKLMDKIMRIYFKKPEFYEYRKKWINAAKEDTDLTWKRSSNKQIRYLKQKIISQSEQ